METACEHLCWSLCVEVVHTYRCSHYASWSSMACEQSLFRSPVWSFLRRLVVFFAKVSSFFAKVSSPRFLRTAFHCWRVALNNQRVTHTANEVTTNCKKKCFSCRSDSHSFRCVCRSEPWYIDSRSQYCSIADSSYSFPLSPLNYQEGLLSIEN